MRGRGWLVEYPIGDQTPATGLPLVSLAGLRHRTARAGWHTRDRVQGCSSVTAGTLGHPDIDHNGSPQVAGRFVVRPTIGLVLGASVASGQFLDQSVVDLLPLAAAAQAISSTRLGGGRGVSARLLAGPR